MIEKIGVLSVTYASTDDVIGFFLSHTQGSTENKNRWKVGHLHIGSGFIKSYWKSPTPIAPNKFRAFSYLTYVEWFYLHILLYRNEVRTWSTELQAKGMGFTSMVIERTTRPLI